MDTKVDFQFVKNKNLLEAFQVRNKKRFEYWLENGANPENNVVGSNYSTFEYLCQHPDGSPYILKCLEYNTDPNTENPNTGLYPIHIAVQHLCVDNIEILLKADHYCANQIVKSDKTPLHMLMEQLNDENLRTVFTIIRLFSELGGVFSWPARKSGQQTPFQMLLEKMTPLLNKSTCMKIIRYLVARHPGIYRFQREKCVQLIEEHFGVLMEENRVIAGWKKKSEDSLLTKDWKTELARLMLENEAKFLVKFDFEKSSRGEELKEYLLDGTLFNKSIELNRFESFVTILTTSGLNFKNLCLDEIVDKILDLHLYKFLKHIFDFDVVTKIKSEWMSKIVAQIEDKKSNNVTNIQKCFHIVMDHRKYNMDEIINDSAKLRAITQAAYKSKYSMKKVFEKRDLLQKGNQNAEAMIRFIDNGAVKQILDSCVTWCISGESTENDFSMVIDYSFLEARKEMTAMKCMAESRDLKALITHPVVASFLFLKWLRLTKIFYLNLLFFSINATSFSIYLGVYYVNLNHLDVTGNAWYQLWKMLSYWSVLVFCIKEAIQLIGSPKNYFRSVDNYFEMGLTCLMVMVLFVQIEDQETRCTIAAVLFLGFAIEWTLIFSALPLFAGSNYIVMLKKVFLHFSQTFAFFSVILLAFAISFHTLVNKSKDINQKLPDTASNSTKKVDKLDDPDESSMFAVSFQIFLMLTGDFGTITEKSQHLVIGRIFLVIFVFSMTIVLMNLLIGLTVSDTSAIEKKAEWHKWCERTKLLAGYESMFFTCLTGLNSEKLEAIVHPIIKLMPSYLPLKKINIEISSKASNQQIYIPREEHLHITENKGNSEKDAEKEVLEVPFPLLNYRNQALCRCYFGIWKVPIKLDKRIIEDGLKVLAHNQAMKSKQEKDKKKKAHRDEMDRTLNFMKRQQCLLIENNNIK